MRTSVTTLDKTRIKLKYEIDPSVGELRGSDKGKEHLLVYPLGRRAESENRPVVVERILNIENKEVLNERQKRFLDLIAQRGEVGRAEYVAMFGKEFCLTTLYWDLRDLREQGLVKMSRMGRFSYYRLGKNR